MVTRVLVFAIGLVPLFLPRPSFAQQRLSAGNVLIAAYEHYSIGEVPIPQELALFDSNGTLLRVLNDRSCGGLHARSATETIICSAYSRLVVLDTAGSPVRSLLDQRDFEHLGEIAPAGSKRILIAEKTAPITPRIAVLTDDGELEAAHAIPRASEMFPLGVESMDLLPDRCTLVYTLGWHYAVDFRRVARFDVCSGHALPDLFRLPESTFYAGGIRVLANGDILVATGYDTRRFNQAGQEKAIYYGAARLLSLTPDGSGFWAAAGPKAQRFTLLSSFPVSSPIIAKYNTIGAMAVVDEWRAANERPRRRGISRR